MANNTAAIAQLETILNNGVKTTVVDGLTVQFDFEQIRKRIAELKAADDNTTNKRRLFTRIRTPWN